MAGEKILFDERGIREGTPYRKGEWREIATHSATEVRGYFGDYRFLSNFWPCVVWMGDQYFPSVENAYQAAKFKKQDRTFFHTCTAREAILFAREQRATPKYSPEEWDKRKLPIMQDLVRQKFDWSLHDKLHPKLRQLKGRYLEETNWWGDTYWGVHKTHKDDPGVGQNQLGRIHMALANML